MTDKTDNDKYRNWSPAERFVILAGVTITPLLLAADIVKGSIW